MMGRAARWAGSVCLLALAFWWAGTSDIWDRLQNVHTGWTLLAFVALNLSTVSMARRWQHTAQKLGLKLRFGPALREYYLSLAVNALVPGGVVGDISRAVRLRSHGDLARAAQSVLAERIIGQLTMLLLACFGVAAALGGASSIGWPHLAAWVIATGLAIGAATIWVLTKTPQTAQFTRFCMRLVMDIRVALHAITSTGLLVAALYACARATGTDLTYAASIALLPLILSAMIIPLSIAGWGWREGTAAAVFPLAGLSAQAGIAMGILYGAVMILAALPGVLIMAFPSLSNRAGATS